MTLNKNSESLSEWNTISNDHSNLHYYTTTIRIKMMWVQSLINKYWLYSGKYRAVIADFISSTHEKLFVFMKEPVSTYFEGPGSYQYNLPHCFGCFSTGNEYLPINCDNSNYNEIHTYLLKRLALNKRTLSHQAYGCVAPDKALCSTKH